MPIWWIKSLCILVITALSKICVKDTSGSAIRITETHKRVFCLCDKLKKMPVKKTRNKEIRDKNQRSLFVRKNCIKRANIINNREDKVSVANAVSVDPVSHASMILNWDGKAIYTDPV